MMSMLPLAFWTPSPAELVVIMIIALLLFGRRLPEVARNLGKGVVEFKKGLKGVEDDIDQDSSSYSSSATEGAALPYESDASKPPAEPASPTAGDSEPK